MQELLRIPSSTVSRAATLRNSVVTSGSPRGTVIELILPSGSIAAPWGQATVLPVVGTPSREGVRSLGPVRRRAAG